MNLDRVKQLEFLKALAAVYPRYAADFWGGEPSEEDLANLWYLKEQELVDGDLEMSLGQSFIFGGAKITAKGLDFLADDGGISAILNTVTVKIHPDTLRELLVSKFEKYSVPPDKKSWLKRQIETASNETIKKILGAVLDEGVKHVPDLINLVTQAAKSIT